MMKKTHFIYRIVSVIMIMAMLLSLTGCGRTESEDPEAGEAAGTGGQGQASHISDSSDPTDKAAGFALELFRKCYKDGENILVSPLSVMAALAMTANGAGGETLAQMEKVLGMTSDEMNSFFRSLMETVPGTDKCRLSLANSLWMNSVIPFTPSPEFIKKNTDYLKADLFTERFDDAALKKINGWVNDKTDGMIPAILDEIKSDAVMYLINALVFDAEWAAVYTDAQVRDDVFTCADGAKKDIVSMFSSEWSFLSGDNAKGFIKHYADCGFAFAALLPDEGVNLSDYIASLDGAELRAMLSGASSIEVRTSIPKFDISYSEELSGMLKEMGMPLAFDKDDADFSGLSADGGKDYYISRVIHKTHICVDERGTKAGAATAVEMMEKSAFMEPQPYEEVYLNRPFVYMLIETGSNTPFFIGCVNELG